MEIGATKRVNEGEKVSDQDDRIPSFNIKSSHLSLRAQTNTICLMKDSPMILLVDDNVFNLIAIETILNHKYHLSVDKAMNGQQAFDKVQ